MNAQLSGIVSLRHGLDRVKRKDEQQRRLSYAITAMAGRGAVVLWLSGHFDDARTLTCPPSPASAFGFV